jgi:hypothetical protein
MKFNFRKVASVLATAVMLGSTAGFALAANYPSPFVVGGVSYAVIVTGANAPLDMSAATTIQSDLDSKTTAITEPISVDGESVKIERSADKFNIGENASALFITSMTKNNLPNLLADGILKGEDSEDYEYTQKIQLSENLILSHFRDYDYKQDTPTLGFQLAYNTEVLTYTLDFTTAPNITAAAAVTQFADIEIMGKPYFISESSETTLTLLDSSVSEVILEGETKTLTVDGIDYVITPVGFTANDVRLSINGETTSALVKGEVLKIADDVYLGVKDYIPVQVERDARMVEVVMGNGKIELDSSGGNVQVNDKDVRELTSTFTLTSSHLLSKLAIVWTTDDEIFITDDMKVTMPIFGNIDLVMAGMTFPEGEEILVQGDSSRSIRLTAPIKDGSANINLLYTGSTIASGFAGIGKDANNLLVTSPSDTLTFNQTLNDRMFVVSWVSGSESESYVVKASIDSENKTTVTNEITGSTLCSGISIGSQCTVGNSILYVSDALGVSSTNRYVTLVANSSETSFNTLYTAKGLKIYLPWINTTGFNLTTQELAAGNCSVIYGTLAAGQVGYVATLTNNSGTTVSCNSLPTTTAYTLNMTEALTTTDARGTGVSFGATLNHTGGTTASPKVEVSSVIVTGASDTAGLQVKETEEYTGYVNSDYSTNVLHKTSGDQDSAVITYYGDEVYGNVFLASSAAVTASTSTVKIMKDSEVMPTNKNLIVVGGSCVNSLAAKIMDVPEGTCGDNQDVIAQDKYIVKVVAASSVVDGAQDGKIAVLVAGWEAADTQKAANKLLEATTSTDVGTLIDGPATGA